MPSARIISVIASREGPRGSHGRPNPLHRKGVTPSPWRWSLLLFAAFLAACDRAGEAERILASAEQSRKAGQLDVAADLYHRAADLRAGDFDTLYQAALLDLQVDNLDEAEGHLRKVLTLRNPGLCRGLQHSPGVDPVSPPISENLPWYSTCGWE